MKDINMVWLCVWVTGLILVLFFGLKEWWDWFHAMIILLFVFLLFSVVVSGDDEV